MAACLTLLAVSGLMTGKLLRIRTAHTGLSSDGVYLVVSAARGGAANALADDPRGAVETLRALPGVASACLVAGVPLYSPGGNSASMEVKTAADRPPTRVNSNLATAHFFRTLGVPILQGRGFTSEEETSEAAVVVVSESAARHLWPGEDPIGKVLSVDATTLDRRRGLSTPVATKAAYREHRVVGVSRDYLSNWNEEEGGPLVMFPLPAKVASARVLIRLQADSTGIVRGVESTAAAAGVPVKFLARMDAIMDRSAWPYRVFAAISGGLTVLAVGLATVGLYGVVSFGVNQRVREIGVRMALGATAKGVTGLFVRQGMRLVALGTGLGLAGATALTVLLAKALPGAGFVGPLGFNGAVFAVVTLFLAGVALVACWLPARRAARVDPMVALRAE